MGDMGRMGGMGFMGGKSFVGVGRPAVAEAMAGKLRLGGRRGQTRARALPVGGWEQIAADQPFLEAALTPLAEVLLADGEALKFLCDDFPDFFEGVERSRRSFNKSRMERGRWAILPLRGFIVWVGSGFSFSSWPYLDNAYDTTVS
jgi:hypothetical protein